MFRSVDTEHLSFISYSREHQQFRMKLQLQYGLEFKIQCLKIKELVTRETLCRPGVSKSYHTVAKLIIHKF